MRRSLADAQAQQAAERPTSYMPVDITRELRSIIARMKAAKAGVEKRQADLLAERYDLAEPPAPRASTMSRGKPVQEGVRVEAAAGRDLGAARGDDARGDPRRRTSSRPASCRCRTRTIPKAACSSRKFHIDEIKKQEGRDLTRFDLDFDLPDHFLPEFPPPIFLTTRPDLGDVSQGKLVTHRRTTTSSSTAS